MGRRRQLRRAQVPPPSRERPVALGLAVAGLLLVTWPFVRTPRPHLLPAYLFLLGAWGALIVALWLLARALSRGPRGGGRAGDRGA